MGISCPAVIQKHTFKQLDVKLSLCLTTKTLCWLNSIIEMYMFE